MDQEVTAGRTLSPCPPRCGIHKTPLTWDAEHREWTCTVTTPARTLSPEAKAENNNG